MTHKSTSRLLRTENLTRVEGEGSLRVEIRDGVVVDVELAIYEPPRFFEGFLRGRSFQEPPDITARICGICPVAYQMSACAAIEDACGVLVDGALRDLRLLLYCGEWIESHTLHIHFLHAPDFLGFDSAIEMAAVHRPEVLRALELKKIGNEILELLGGRSIHPVNVRVGGFYRVPTAAELAPLRARLLEAERLAQEVVDWVAGFAFPQIEMPYELVALSHPDEYPMLGRQVTSDRGLSLTVDDLAEHLVEFQVPYSTAKHAHLLKRGEYLVGPLARFTLNAEKLMPTALAAATRAGLNGECRNPYRSIVVRAVEVLHAVSTAIAVVDRYRRPPQAVVGVEAVAGVGHGATEAPRGLLYHRYELDADGLIVDADIVPPTSQNQATIEHDLWHFVEDNLEMPDDELRRGAEVSIRNHDPCISCATHFLDMTVTRT